VINKRNHFARLQTITHGYAEGCAGCSRFVPGVFVSRGSHVAASRAAFHGTSVFAFKDKYDLVARAIHLHQWRSSILI
jgi:hypothetical protein